MFGNFAKIGRARRGESNLANFQTSRVLLIPNCTSNIACLLVYYSHDKIGYFSMSTSYSLAKAQSCQTFNQNLVLLFVFSFSSFIKAKFGAFV
jgi:hypothetical protein